jgi:hypothetical protein
VREYSPEYESFKDDALAVLSGAAVVIATVGFWSKPLFMGPIALAVALLAYLLSPRSRGGTIVAVLVLTLLAILGRWLMNYSIS